MTLKDTVKVNLNKTVRFMEILLWKNFSPHKISTFRHREKEKELIQLCSRSSKDTQENITKNYFPRKHYNNCWCAGMCTCQMKMSMTFTINMPLTEVHFHPECKSIVLKRMQSMLPPRIQAYTFYPECKSILSP